MYVCIFFSIAYLLAITEHTLSMLTLIDHEHYHYSFNTDI